MEIDQPQGCIFAWGIINIINRGKIVNNRPSINNYFWKHLYKIDLACIDGAVYPSQKLILLTSYIMLMGWNDIVNVSREVPGLSCATIGIVFSTMSLWSLAENWERNLRPVVMLVVQIVMDTLSSQCPNCSQGVQQSQPMGSVALIFTSDDSKPDPYKLTILGSTW